MALDPWTLLLLPGALGHVLYGLPRHRRPDGAVDFVSLHNGDDFAATDEPPRPDRLIGVRAESARGRVAVPVVTRQDGAVGADVSGVETPAWLVAETPPAFIELAAPAFTRYLAHEGLTHVLAARTATGTAAAAGREVYSKHIKVALGAGGGGAALPAAVVGLPVELVPGAASVAPGDSLAVRLVAGGAAAADVQVLVHHKATDDGAPRQVSATRTDAGGGIAIEVDQPGLWRLHAIVMTAHPDPAVAEWRSHWACLSFRL